MKFNIKIVLLVVAAVAIGVFVGSFAMRGKGVGDSSNGSCEKVKVVKTKNGGKVKKITEVSLIRDGKGENSIRIVESEEGRPNLLAEGDDIDEEQLSPRQKSIVKELQEALDNDDYKEVKRVLSKFTASVSSGGLGGNVPKIMRKKAIEALGWFGPKAAVDMVDYLFDADTEVVDEAFDKFEFMLQDSDLSDYNRSEIVKTLMATLTDAERIDSILNSLTDMRNSVRADTITTILKSGTAEAKAQMLDQIEFHTEIDVQTIDDVEKWAAMNPDDEGDEEFYGGSK